MAGGIGKTLVAAHDQPGGFQSATMVVGIHTKSQIAIDE